MVEALLSVSCEASHLPSVQTADLTGPARSPTEIHVSIHSWQRRHTVPLAVLGAALALGAAAPALASPGHAPAPLPRPTPRCILHPQSLLMARLFRPLQLLAACSLKLAADFSERRSEKFYATIRSCHISGPIRMPE
mgnify:CR=1 FL=1